MKSNSVEIRFSNWLILILLPFLFFCHSRERENKDSPRIDLEENGGLYLPDDFVATAVVNQLKGQARHLAVNNNGDIYVKLRNPPEEGGNAVLRDINGDNKADTIIYFGDLNIY